MTRPDDLVELLVLVVILGVFAFRVTRFIVADSLIEGTREKFLTWLLGPKNLPLWRDKLAELLTCYWCVGVWVSLGAVVVAWGAWPWQLGRAGWLAVGATAGVQAFANHVTALITRVAPSE